MNNNTCNKATCVIGTPETFVEQTDPLYQLVYLPEMRTKNLYFFILFLILFFPFWGFRMQWSFCFTLLTMDSGPFLWCSSFLSSPIYKAVFYVNYFILIAWKMMLILRLARRSQQVNSKWVLCLAKHSGWTTSTMISSELMFVHWNPLKNFIKNAREKWAVLPVIFVTRTISVQMKIRLTQNLLRFQKQ